MPPSLHTFASHELPAPFAPGGTNWMEFRLAQSYTNPQAFLDHDDPDTFYLRVDEANVSKSQLGFDVTPIDGVLSVDQSEINVPPLSTVNVLVSGPPNKLVKVRFEGTGYTTEPEQFQLSGGGTYSFQFGACPGGQMVVTPQQYEFYVEDGSTAPVAVLATFR